MKKVFGFLCTALMALSFAACDPEENTTPDNPITPDPSGESMGKALVLNEGTWGGNNSSLTLVDLDSGTVSNNWFASQNGRGLGDVGQDMVVYGSKAYVSVWGSNSIEVVDTATGISTRIDMGTRGPRYIAADGGKIYVSCYLPHSVVRIDTASRQIEATCELGAFNPEGVAVAGGKLFVASSNVSNEQGAYSYDNKVYVIDLGSFANPTAVEVGCNPQKVMPLGNGKVIVNCWGNYDDNPAGSAVVDAASLAVVQTGQAMTNMAVGDGVVYAYNTAYDEYYNTTVSYFKMDANTFSTTAMSISSSEDPYAIAVHPVSGDIFIATNGNYSANGTLMCYSPDGTTRRWTREMGMLPSKVVFF